MERGTLYQIQNLIRQEECDKRPKDHVTAAEDFLELVIISHVLTAAMSYLCMTSLTDIPSPCIVSQDVWMEDDTVRRRILTEISTSIIDQHVDLETAFHSGSPSTQTTGTVYNYCL